MSNEPTIAKWKCTHKYDDGSLGEITVEPDETVTINNGSDTVYVYSYSQCQQIIKALKAAAAQQWPEEAET